MRLAPAAAASSAALAAIQAKMPVVMGQAMVVPCFLAKAARSSLMLVSLPLGTLSMSSLTSMGAGTTKVPVPQRVLSLPSILPTLGRSLLSRSFSPQVLRAFIGCEIQIRNHAFGKLGNEVAFVGMVYGEDDEDEFFTVGEFDAGGVVAGLTGPAGFGPEPRAAWDGGTGKAVGLRVRIGGGTEWIASHEFEHFGGTFGRDGMTGDDLG